MSGYDFARARERHVEPHVCPREDPSSACDFNRFRREAADRLAECQDALALCEAAYERDVAHERIARERAEDGS